MCRHWFHRLNDAVFDGILPAPDDIVMSTGNPDWLATFERYLDNEGWILGFNEAPMSRAAFLELLVHEMVHCAVAFLDGDVRCVHGDAFMAYAGRVAERAGLPLRDGFYGEPEDLCPST